MAYLQHTHLQCKYFMSILIEANLEGQISKIEDFILSCSIWDADSNDEDLDLVQ